MRVREGVREGAAAVSTSHENHCTHPNTGASWMPRCVQQAKAMQASLLCSRGGSDSPPPVICDLDVGGDEDNLVHSEEP